MSKRQVSFDDCDDGVFRARLAPLAETVLPATPQLPRISGAVESTRTGVRWRTSLAAAAGAFLSAGIGAAAVYILAQRQPSVVPVHGPVITRHNTLDIELPPDPYLPNAIGLRETPQPQGLSHADASPAAATVPAASGKTSIKRTGAGAPLKHGEQVPVRRVPHHHAFVTTAPVPGPAVPRVANMAQPLSADAGTIRTLATTPNHAPANGVGKTNSSQPLQIQVESGASPEFGSKPVPTVTAQTVAPASAQHSENTPAPKHKAPVERIRSKANRISSDNLPDAMLLALIRRGDAELRNGDVAAARMLYEQAAEGGLAEAAHDLARTYDATFLHRIGARGIAPDEALAASWRRRADQLDASGQVNARQ